MSKQSEARIKQNYQAKAFPLVCLNCKHYESEKSTVAPINQFAKEYVKETNQRCAIGGFAVKKMGRCDLFEKSTKL